MKATFPFDDKHPQYYRIPGVKLCDDISVIEVGYNRVPSGLRQIMKRNVFILHYITDGKGKFLGAEISKNIGYIVVPGELEIVEADKVHPYESYWIMFEGTNAADIIKKCNLPEHNGVFEFKKSRQCADIIRKALFDISPVNEFEESCIIHSAFYQILAFHMQTVKDTESISVVQKIRDFIKNNYHKPISIGELALEYNYTRNHIYKLFKTEYNMSPQEYLLSLRIEKAKQLLKDESENFSVSDISTMTGFNDPLYFSRIFRQKTGLSPTKYRT